MKPLIGITPLYDQNLDSTWILEAYVDAVKAAGGVPVVLSFVEDDESVEVLASSFDGFVFTGGQDIDPALYGQEKKTWCGSLAPKRDVLETKLLQALEKRDVPLLLICRGLQLANALRGGSLYQDLEKEEGAELNHDREKPYEAIHHRVTVSSQGPLGKVLPQEFGVNSLHHQGISRLGEGLVAFATSEDGLVEAFYDPKKKFYVGLQWHPELRFLEDEATMKIWTALIEAARR